MLPSLTRLSLDNHAPVGTGADGEEEEQRKRRKVDATDVAPNVLMGLPEDVWLNIMQNVDYVDVCGEIGRICKSASAEPLRGLCQKDSTYNMLNHKMGLYGDGGTLSTLKAWALTSTTPLARYIVRFVGSEKFKARDLFVYVCLERKLVVDNMKRYMEVPADRLRQKEYRINIQTFLRYKTPGWGARAKWIVSLHPIYAFEFIPGSMTTQERSISLDLQPGLPFQDPGRERARHAYTIMWSEHRESVEATWADVAVPNWVEIAKMAIKDAPFNFEHVPGWIDDASGYQPFPPCPDFAEIAKLAVEGDPYNFANVPGSTLNPEKHDRERFLPDAVSNYTEIAKLAAKGIHMLRHVPGSIAPWSGNQLRAPIPDYYDIAEVHLRIRGWNLRYVPPDLPGYAALVKIALDENLNAFKFVPIHHKDYKELEAYRDARLPEDR